MTTIQVIKWLPSGKHTFCISIVHILFYLIRSFVQSVVQFCLHSVNLCSHAHNNFVSSLLLVVKCWLAKPAIHVKMHNFAFIHRLILIFCGEYRKPVSAPVYKHMHLNHIHILIMIKYSKRWDVSRLVTMHNKKHKIPLKSIETDFLFHSIGNSMGFYFWRRQHRKLIRSIFRIMENWLKSNNDEKSWKEEKKRNGPGKCCFSFSSEAHTQLGQIEWQIDL